MNFIAILHNIRSAHNVGACFRTADGAGIQKIYVTGYTLEPWYKDWVFLTPAQKMLAKTALGAEKDIPWERRREIGKLLRELKKEGFEIVILEQSEKSIDYRAYKPKKKIALLVGNEVRGVDAKILKQCNKVIEIPMRGKKNSLNVSVAFGIASFAIQSKIKGGHRG